MRHRQGLKWMRWLLALSALAAGCGGSLSQGAQEGEPEPGVHWEPAQLRADGGDTALLEVRVEGPSAVCEVALSREADDAAPTWQPMTLEGGQLTRGGRVSETALPATAAACADLRRTRAEHRCAVRERGSADCCDD